MADQTEFARPHHLTTRESMLRPESRNTSQSSGGGTVAYGTDDGMIVEFYDEPVLMEALSADVGHPIFQMRIMTRIYQPGNRTTVWVHQTKGIKYEMCVDEESKEYFTDWELQEVTDAGEAPEPNKYPAAWNRFLKKGIATDRGTPIEEWGVVTKSYAMSLKALHIHSVEQLAGLSDQSAQSIMGGRKYRDLAKAHLDDREKTRLVSHEQERASRFEEMCASQAKQIEELRLTVGALQHRLSDRAIDTPMPQRQVHPGHIQTEMAARSEENMVKSGSMKKSKAKHKLPQSEEAA